MPLKVCYYMVNPNSFDLLQLKKAARSVLHHTSVILSCVKEREEMFILIGSRLVPSIQSI